MTFHAGSTWIDVVALVGMPAVAFVCAATEVPGASAITLVVSVMSLAALASALERGRPSLRRLMPTVVLASLAAAGRVLFAPLPDVKPVSAIAIVAGATLGARSGFAVGSLAALASNLFFGQGPWTPLQMYAWGLVGYLSGVLQHAGAFRRRGVVLAYGFVSGLLYGIILNGWHVLGFVRPLTWQAALLAFAAGLPLDLVHGAATVAFLVAIWEPWTRSLARAVARHALRGEST